MCSASVTSAQRSLLGAPEALLGLLRRERLRAPRRGGAARGRRRVGRPRHRGPPRASPRRACTLGCERSPDRRPGIPTRCTSERRDAVRVDGGSAGAGHAAPACRFRDGEPAEVEPELGKLRPRGMSMRIRMRSRLHASRSPERRRRSPRRRWPAPRATTRSLDAARRRAKACAAHDPF